MLLFVGKRAVAHLLGKAGQDGAGQQQRGEEPTWGAIAAAGRQGGRQAVATSASNLIAAQLGVGATASWRGSAQCWRGPLALNTGADGDLPEAPPECTPSGGWPETAARSLVTPAPPVRRPASALQGGWALRQDVAAAHNELSVAWRRCWCRRLRVCRAHPQPRTSARLAALQALGCGRWRLFVPPQSHASTALARLMLNAPVIQILRGGEPAGRASSSPRSRASTFSLKLSCNQAVANPACACRANRARLPCRCCTRRCAAQLSRRCLASARAVARQRTGR